MRRYQGQLHAPRDRPVGRRGRRGVLEGRRGARGDGTRDPLYGGFGADLSDSSLLQEVESEWCSLKAWDPVKQLPALRFLPTTNGEHCTGDGIKMGLFPHRPHGGRAGAPHRPRGPGDPDSKVRFLAAEAYNKSTKKYTSINQLPKKVQREPA